MCSAMIRARASTAPPGGSGTMIVMGRDGNVCAVARRDAAGSAAALTARCKNLRRGICMTISQLLGRREPRGLAFSTPSRCDLRLQPWNHLIKDCAERRRRLEAEEPLGLLHRRDPLLHVVDEGLVANIAERFVRIDPLP